MEVYIYDRPWENTYRTVVDKLTKKLNRIPTELEITDMMNIEVSKGKVDPEAFDILKCESNDAYLAYDKKLQEVNNLVTNKFKLKPIFNEKIKNKIESILDKKISGAVASTNPTFTIIYDRLNTPSQFYDSHPYKKLFKGLVISMQDLLAELFYINPIALDFPILSLYPFLNSIKKEAEKIKIANLEDYKKFEDYWTHKKDYLNPSSYKKTERTILLERSYQTRHNIQYVGQYMVYGLLHRALNKGVDITLLDYDRNPYRINCILNTHFPEKLKNYQINYYFPIYSNNSFLQQKIKILQNGLHHYSEEIAKYELYTQNSLIYAVVYLKANIFLYDVEGDEIVTINKDCQYKNNNLILEKYLKLASFCCQNIVANAWIPRQRDFVYNQKLTVAENEEVFKKSPNYAIHNAELENYYNNFIKTTLQPVDNPEIIFIYGPIASGKSTYSKRFHNHAFINKDSTSTEIQGYISESQQVENKINNMLKIFTDYPEQLTKVLKKTLQFHEKHQIWLKYVQYGILLLYRLLKWAVENKYNIVNDIGGTDLYPAINVINYIKNSASYSFHLHAIHTQFQTQYTNQLIRAREENRYVSRSYLLNQSNSSFANLLLFIKNPDYKYVEVKILDNTKKLENYPVLYTRNAELNCNIKNIDAEEKEFLKLWEYICPTFGRNETDEFNEKNEFNKKNIILVIIIIFLLIIIFLHNSFNFLNILHRKIFTMS